jgi:hypothetical protein
MGGRNGGVRHTGGLIVVGVTRMGGQNGGVRDASGLIGGGVTIKGGRLGVAVGGGVVGRGTIG